MDTEEHSGVGGGRGLRDDAHADSIISCMHSLDMVS